MDLFPKFIIVDDHGTLNLILMKVTYHKDIFNRCLELDSKIKIVGGGWFTFDKDKNVLKFYDSSSDFGSPSYEQIKDCCDNNRIYTNHYYHERHGWFANLIPNYDYYSNNQT